MSSGPISQWWKSHAPPRVSTADAHRVCASGPEKGRAYCGRRKSKIANVAKGEGRQVTCSDCIAAARADDADRTSSAG